MNSVIIHSTENLIIMWSVHFKIICQEVSCFRENVALSNVQITSCLFCVCVSSQIWPYWIWTSMMWFLWPMLSEGSCRICPPPSFPPPSTASWSTLLKVQNSGPGYTTLVILVLSLFFLVSYSLIFFFQHLLSENLYSQLRQFNRFYVKLSSEHGVCLECITFNFIFGNIWETPGLHTNGLLKVSSFLVSSVSWGDTSVTVNVSEPGPAFLRRGVGVWCQFLSYNLFVACCSDQVGW